MTYNPKDSRRSEIIWHTLSFWERVYLSFRFLIAYGTALFSAVLGLLFFLWMSPYSSALSKTVFVVTSFGVSFSAFVLTAFMLGVQLEPFKQGIANKAVQFGDKAEELFYMKCSALWGNSYSISAVFIFSLLVYGGGIFFFSSSQ